LGVRENNIGNGGKKGVRIKTQKQSLQSLQRETYVKVVTIPAYH
jgi:hypothetical protein